MLGLHRIDGVLPHNPAANFPRVEDWAEAENRRRVFWCVYNIDRYSSFGTSFPATLSNPDVSFVD